MGQDVVFGGGQHQPDTPGGRRLLAHELAHVAQQSGPVGPSADARVQRACLPDAECAAPQGEPRAGSAKAFGAAAEKAAAPKRGEMRRGTATQAQAAGHGRRAVEIEKLFAQHLPDLRPLIHGVFVDIALPEDARAMRGDCLAWAQSLPPGSSTVDFQNATHSCVFVPKKLEEQAAAYNQLKKPTLEQQNWIRWLVVRMLTHEATHERFRAARIAFPASTTCTATSLAIELSELAAAISEFPHVKDLPSRFLDAWSTEYLTDPRQLTAPTESISGSIRDIRCSCECGEADALIRHAFELASAAWSEEERKEFMPS